MTNQRTRELEATLKELTLWHMNERIHWSDWPAVHEAVAHAPLPDQMKMADAMRAGGHELMTVMLQVSWNFWLPIAEELSEEEIRNAH